MVWIKPFHLLFYLNPISYFKRFYEYENEVLEWPQIIMLGWRPFSWVLDLSIVFHLEFIEYLNNLFDCKALLMVLNLLDSKTIQCT
jgi:hypothetical protein